MVKKKDIAFIFEKNGVEEFLKLIDSENEIVIICSSQELKKKITELNYLCKTIDEYGMSEYNQKALEWIKSWPDKNIIDDKSIKKIFVYDNLSLFWFLETRLYLYRIHELILLIERIKNVLKQENPQNIWIKGDYDIKHIVSKLLPNVIKKYESKSKSKRTVTYKSYQGFPTLKLFLLKLFRGIGSPSIQKNLDNNKILIITEVSSWRTDFDYSTKKFVTKDVFFHDIIKNLKEKSQQVIIIDFENRPRKLFKGRSLNEKRRKSMGVRVEPWEKFITFELIKKSKLANRKIIETWNNLKNSKEFEKSLIYDEMSISDLVKQDIDYLFKTFKAYTAITLIETAKKIIEHEQPQIIVMHDEYGALQLAFLKAAKEKGIPTVSLQHGLITDNLLPYFHKLEHIKNKNKSLIFPLPDRMCVWSEESRKNLLEKGNFPPSIPIVTGDPKVDFLSKVIKSFDVDEIRKKLKIKEGKRIILFATENLPKKEEQEIIAKSVISTFKSLKDVHLIIKPHPNELDISLYQNLISKFELLEYSIITDINLYELLFVSDLVILSYSTVGVEAMRMGKPVISLNLLGLHDDALIIQKNAAVVVRNSDELLPTIKQYLNSKFSQKLIENGKIFAEKELGEIDGNAANRIVDQILQLKNQK